MHSISIGCPIFNRAWVLDTYLKHLSALIPPKGMSFKPLFGLSINCYDGTNERIIKWCKDRDGDFIIHPPSKGYVRGLGGSDYLASLRNAMLEFAFEQSDYFMSIDSDIIIDPYAVRKLYGLFENNSRLMVAGPPVRMSPDPKIFNYLFFDKTKWRFTRQNGEIEQFGREPFVVQEIGGCALYKKSNARFAAWDNKGIGEDEGYAIDVMELHGKMLIDPTIFTAHYYDQQNIFTYIPQGE